MNGSRTLTLNDKGILLIATIILCLVFALGFMTSDRTKREQSGVIFTREDLERIVELQQMEDEKRSGAEIYAYKDENDHLMIGWDHGDTKR